MTPDDDEYGRELEERAEELGLPTDPEAYQDGGLVPAATGINLAQADVLATVLKASGIPAWVDSPLSALYSDGYQRPRIAVLVPLGRLADARRLIAEHAHHETPTEESPDAPEPAAPTPRRSKARVAASLIILGFGIGEVLLVLLAVGESISQIVPWGLQHILTFCLVGALGAAASVIGIIGLRASLSTAGHGDRGTRAAEPTTEEPEGAAEPTEESVVPPSPRAPCPSLGLMALGLVILLVGVGAVAYAVTGFVLFLILVYFDPMEAVWLIVWGIAGIATCPFGVRLWCRGRRGRRLGASDRSAGG
jgi:hypothetical protein